MPLPIRILLVDDEGPIRNSLAGFLEDYDFDVSTAAVPRKRWSSS